MGKRSREKKEKKDMGTVREVRDNRNNPESGWAVLCKWIIYIGTALSLFTPLVANGKFFFPFVGPKSIYFMGLAEIIFIAWLILIIINKEYRPKFNLIQLSLVLFLIVMIISAIYGVNFSNSFWSKFERMTGILMWFHLLAFFFVISSTFKKIEDWKTVFSISVFSAMITTFLVLISKLGVSVFGAAGQGGATIGNTSFVGTYLLFNVFFALYLFLQPPLRHLNFYLFLQPPLQHRGFEGFRKFSKLTLIFIAILSPVLALLLYVLHKIGLDLFYVISLITPLLSLYLWRKTPLEGPGCNGFTLFLFLFIPFYSIILWMENRSKFFEYFNLTRVLCLIGAIFFLSLGLGASFLLNKLSLGTPYFKTIDMAFAVLIFLFLAWLAFSKRDNLKYILFFVPFLIMVLTLFLISAQAATLSVVVGLFLVFLLWLIFRKKGMLKWAGISLLLILIVSTFAFIYLGFQSDSYVRKQLIERTVGETFGGRFIVWQGAWQGFLQKPVWGWGPENFEFSFIKNYNPCMGTPKCGGDVWYDRAHNVVLDNLVAGGVVGLVFYLLIFGAVFLVLWKSFFKNRNNFWIAVIFSAALIAYFAQNLTVFDMINSYLVFFLILGFAASQAVSHKENAPQENQIQNSGGLSQSLIILSVIVLFFFSFNKFITKPYEVDAYVIKAITTQDPEIRLTFLKSAVLISPVGKFQVREFLTDYAQNYYQLDFIIQELEKTATESPYDFRSAIKLGQAYTALGKFDPPKLSKADEVLKKAIEISPKNQQGYWYLAQTKIYEGKFNEALDLAQKAVDLEPNMSRSYLVVIEIAKIMGNKELAKEEAQKAVKLFPELEPQLKSVLEG